MFDSQEASTGATRPPAARGLPRLQDLGGALCPQALAATFQYSSLLDHANLRSFMIEWADRIVFGTDIGWDAVRARRFTRQQVMGLVPRDATLSPRDPQAKPWSELPETTREPMARRMEIYASQIASIDQNIGRLVAKLKRLGQFEIENLVARTKQRERLDAMRQQLRAEILASRDTGFVPEGMLTRMARGRTAYEYARSDAYPLARILPLAERATSRDIEALPDLMAALEDPHPAML